jgi:hypothetical protein
MPIPVAVTKQGFSVTATSVRVSATHCALAFSKSYACERCADCCQIVDTSASPPNTARLRGHGTAAR